MSFWRACFVRLGVCECANAVVSFGIVLWEAVTGDIPFAEEQFESAIGSKVVAGARYDFVLAMFQIQLIYLPGRPSPRNARALFAD